MAPHRLLLQRANRPAAIGFVVMLLLALLPGAAAATTVQAAYPATVDWDSNGIRVNRDEAFYPWGVVDSNNHTHIVYVSNDGGLKYVNDISGSFSSSQTLMRGLKGNRDPYHALAIDRSNVLHVAYVSNGAGNDVYYQRGTINGSQVAWSDRVRVSSGGKSYAAHVAADKDGNAHVVWIENRCGQYVTYYRRVNKGGGLSGVERPRDECTYHNRPQVAVTNDGKVHVVFQRGNEVYYARRDSSGWNSENLSRSGSVNSLNPTITTDGTAIYVAWDEGVNNHDIKFRRSQDGGQNWSNTITFSGSDSFASFPNAHWSAAARRVFVVWSDDAQDNLEIWAREFDPSNGRTTEADRLDNLPSDSFLPIIGAGPKRVDVVWQDKAAGARYVYHVKGDIIGGGGTCSGQVVLNSGAAETTNPALTATITPSQGCNPTEMQVSLDTPISSTTPRQPYNASVQLSVTDFSVCEHTVSVRLFAGSISSAVFSDTIIVDNRVDASVSVTNPFFGGSGGDGHPNYSRNGQARLNVTDAGDCKGLKDVTFPNGNTPQTQPISGGVFSSTFTLSGGQDEGEKSFTVTVSDQLGNRTTFPPSPATFTIIYDKTPPKLTNADQAKVTGPITATNVLVTLTFSNTNVTDNLFGPREGRPKDKQFWGVYAASSQKENASDAELHYVPLSVARVGDTFSIQWSLFTGLGFGGNLTGREGDYYVYVKFLDGAGNVSTERLVSNKIRLEKGYGLIPQYLPAVTKQ